MSDLQLAKIIQQEPLRLQWGLSAHAAQGMAFRDRGRGNVRHKRTMDRSGKLVL